ncbi:regulator of volume decrease after cellular swelling-domain-containing protein [Mucidula mucida]|nr:regulator of volume decrease after cellular swelling-domain-containing protein [Mucidula mucida]
MAVVLTSTIPPFNTPDDHRALVSSTPENLADIPAVLRHKQDNVRVSFDPAIDGQPEWGTGTLYVIDSFLVFIQAESGKGFQIEYPAITLHAISRAEGEVPNIYCQLDDAFGNLEVLDGEDEQMRELIITPSDPTSLDAIFEALSLCASLHPDEPSPSDDEDDAFVDADDFDAYDDDEGEELSEVGKVRSDFINDNRYQPY